VIGNPPYSVGQKSANDLNANQKYPSLDARIAETYAARSTATNKNSLYDSYLRAFRWATDRIGDQGVVVFVTNNGWIDGNTGDGIRLSMAEDFTDLYIFNLRGNSRTAGDVAKREGGNVFDIRLGISIAIGVKDANKKSFELHYAASPDFASKAQKIEDVVNATIGNLNWQSIVPNQDGDWLNQRSKDFATWPVIGEKKVIQRGYSRYIPVVFQLHEMRGCTLKRKTNFSTILASLLLPMQKRQMVFRPGWKLRGLRSQRMQMLRSFYG